ncbi:DJ-1/PfpI family protein [Jiangella muralis]|uniref:DJ-1/PfpI family protein n=1 Tax=Jiangella muralis TaxID=702383 RepID=UPI00069EA4D5|nr:DJ-1/PfpI family protein [Jiangella muralis]
MKVAILIYPGFTALDATGPFEVFNRLPQAEITFISPDGGDVVADYPTFRLPSDAMADTAPPDVVVVAGGSRTHDQLGREDLREWLRACAENSRVVSSVCTGALILGDAGLLEGRRATTHWYELESLRAFGAEPVSERVVSSDKVITCAGVSAGIDMALTVVAQLVDEEYAMATQLSIEYDPQPPFDAGSVRTAPEGVVQHLTEVMRAHYGPPWGERVAQAGTNR